MSAFLWYHRRSRPTGRKLAGVLGIPHGREPRAADVIIRWGNSTPLPAALRNSVVINTGVYNAGDKLRAFDLLQAADVRIPDILRSAPTLDPNSNVVWLGRNRHGFGGTDIRIWRGGELPFGGMPEFWSKFIPNEREYRIHVCNGQAIRVQRKYLDFPADRRSEYIKNYANGYRFRSPARQLNSERTNAAIAAVDALGLDFGAVDCVVGSEDNRTYVLEVNTAPKLSPLTGQKYAEALKELLAEHGVGITLNYDALEAMRD